jgi:hypothetical protein
MFKLLAIAVVAGTLAIAISGNGADLRAGADAVRDGVTSVLPSSVKGQGDEQDGDTGNADEPDNGSQDRQAGDSGDTAEPDSGSDP